MLQNDSKRDVEAKIVGERTLAAHKRLLEELPKLGLRASHNTGHVRAVRLHDDDGRYLFSWIPSAHHLLFYVRKPALNAAPQLGAAAKKALPGVNENPAGELTVRIEGIADAELIVHWLSEHLPLPH
jgi:hypothetical protein